MGNLIPLSRNNLRKKQFLILKKKATHLNTKTIQWNILYALNRLQTYQPGYRQFYCNPGKREISRDSI